MPLFVFVSGYFASGDKGKTARGVARIFETYAVFQLIRLCLSGDWSIANVMTPQWTLWYLLSLCYWRLAALLLPSEFSAKKKGGVLMHAVLMSFVMGFVPIETEFSFQRTFGFFPFFLAGYFSKGTDAVARIRRISHLATGAVVAAFVAGLYVSGRPLYQLWMFQPLAGGGLSAVAWKAVTLCVCVVMSVCMLNLVPAFGGRVARYGRHTLLFYILHTFMIEALASAGLPAGFFPSLAYAALVTATLVLVAKVKGVEKWLTPVTAAAEMFRRREKTA